MTERPATGHVRKAACQASEMLRTLGNPDRLLLLWRLSQGELCVSELEEGCKVTQPTLSQQLCVLRTQRLVRARREGKRIYYSLCDRNARALLGALDRMYCRNSVQADRGRRKW